MRLNREGVVSIIVGLFNVERFLEEKRLSCILNQTWKDLEIILVNDGSADRTPELCRELAATDSRIVLVDKPNGGLGSARNAGMDVATGEFVWFYDVDDEVELDLIEKNVAWMRRFNADMTMFGSWFTCPDTGHTETSHFKDILFESNEALKEAFTDVVLFVPNGNGFVWNKFYRKEFIDCCGARFGEQRIQQDELFNFKLYPYVRRLYISSELLYHYFIYNTGNSRSNYIPDRILIYESIFDGINDLRDRWGLQDKRLEGYFYKRLYQGIENSILFNVFHPDAPSSRRWRKKEFESILSRPTTCKCLEYMGANYDFNLEGKLYYNAFCSHDYVRVSFLRTVFGTLRRVKRRLQKVKLN